MFKYNDYELLYLISEKNDDALEIMYHKYEPLIKKRINDFKIKNRNREDFLQEGFIALDKAIQKYDQNQKKSFNKYFDLILQRRFMHLIRDERDYFYNTVLTENVEKLNEQISFEFTEKKEFDIANLSDFERNIFSFLENGFKPREIADELDLPVKKVYDAVCRIKKKTKRNKLS